MSPYQVRLKRAVDRARSLMRTGTPPALANWKAADEYGLSTTDIAREVGKIAQKVKARKAVSAIQPTLF